VGKGWHRWREVGDKVDSERAREIFISLLLRRAKADKGVNKSGKATRSEGDDLEESATRALTLSGGGGDVV